MRCQRPSTHPGGDHFSSSQQIFASSRRIPTAAEGARPQLSIVRIMNFLWTVCSVSCVSHFDSARRALNVSRTSTHHISTSYRTLIGLFGQAPTRGVTIFLLRNKFLQVVEVFWPSTHPGGDHFSSSQQIFASSRRIPTAAEGARPQLSIVRIMNFLWTVCLVSCVSHFDSARRALNASRTSTHHISTSYRTLIGRGDHFSSSQQIFASSRRIPTAAEGARPQLSIVRIMNFLWTVCSVSCVSHFDSARRALNASRASTHHISTSYRTLIGQLAKHPPGGFLAKHPPGG